jgi:hypothetical protein
MLLHHHRNRGYSPYRDYHPSQSHNVHHSMSRLGNLGYSQHHSNPKRKKSSFPSYQLSFFLSFFLSFPNYTRYFYAVNTEQMFLDHPLKVSHLQGILGNLTILDKINNLSTIDSDHSKRRFRNLDHLKPIHHLSFSLSYTIYKCTSCAKPKNIFCVVKRCLIRVYDFA